MPFWKKRRLGDVPADPTSVEFEHLINDALATLGRLRPEPSDFQHPGRKRELDAALLATAARDKGLDVLRLTSTMQVVSDESLRLGFFQNMCWTLSALDRAITNDKQLTKQVLQNGGLPVAAGAVVKNVEQAVKVFRDIGRPVVVKPIRGSGGKGITVGIRTEEQLTSAVSDLLTRTSRVLVEETIPSVDLRVMVVAGETVATMMRVPAHVDGDGRSSIEELITEKNNVRASNAYLRHVPIKLDAVMESRLAEQRLTPQSVPPPGRRVFLHYKANLGSGGDSLEITGMVHPSITEIAERALGCFNSAHHAGIDLLVERIDAAADQQRVVVCEVNCNNDMPIHVFPLYGRPVDTGRRSMDGYFFSGRDRLPSTSASAPLPNAPKSDTTVSGSLEDQRQVETDFDQQLAYDPQLLKARSPRKLDQLCLRSALEKQGYSSIRYRGRLIFAERDGRDLVFDRSGASVFALRLAERHGAVERLLRVAGVDVVRGQTFRSGNLDGALEFVHSVSGPWIASVTTKAGSRPGIPFFDAGQLEQLWPHLTHNAARIALRQHSNHSLAILLFNGAPTAAAMSRPAPLTADGEPDSSAHARRRQQHPYLRHFPITAVGTSDDDKQDPVATPSSVEAVTETTGILKPNTLAATLTRRVWESIGNPPILAVDLAARPHEAANPTYAVTSLDADPILARFAFPSAGHRPDVYADAAEVISAAQHYAPRSASGV